MLAFYPYLGGNFTSAEAGTTGVRFLIHRYSGGHFTSSEFGATGVRFVSVYSYSGENFPLSKFGATGACFVYIATLGEILPLLRSVQQVLGF